MKHLIALSCIVALAGCSSSDDDSSAITDADTDVETGGMVDTGTIVAVDPAAVFVTPDMVEFQDTRFRVSLLLKLSMIQWMVRMKLLSRLRRVVPFHRTFIPKEPIQW